MFRQYKEVSSKVAVAGLVLSLVGCVVPPPKNDANYPTRNTPAPTAAQQTPVSANPNKGAFGPLLPSNQDAARAQAITDYRQFLENQLLCSTTGLVDLPKILKRSLDAKVIGGKPIRSEEATEIYRYPVLGELSVFGFKVIALEFRANKDGRENFQPNDGGIYVDLDASHPAVEKAVRSRGVRLTRQKGDPERYISAKRPLHQWVSAEYRGKGVRLGCVIAEI